VDTKVPFIVRGPGIEWGSSAAEPVVNIDLAPTFLDLAGVSPLPAHMDGRSILPLFGKSRRCSLKKYLKKIYFLKILNI
jgi:extracellular sulfatase Sulf